MDGISFSCIVTSSFAFGIFVEKYVAHNAPFPDSVLTGTLKDTKTPTTPARTPLYHDRPHCIVIGWLTFQKANLPFVQPPPKRAKAKLKTNAFENGDGWPYAIANRFSAWSFFLGSTSRPPPTPPSLLTLLSQGTQSGNQQVGQTLTSLLHPHGTWGYPDCLLLVIM